LKEEFGGRNVRVRRVGKAMLHLMFRIVSLFADYHHHLTQSEINVGQKHRLQQNFPPSDSNTRNACATGNESESRFDAMSALGMTNSRQVVPLHPETFLTKK
jgi:hypothetical protein